MELAFYFSSIVAILATICVIIHTHPVHALLFLIISFLAIACGFFSVGAYFAGALEVIVYASAIMVLFVFVIMMLNTIDLHNKQGYVFCMSVNFFGALFLSILLLLILLQGIWSMTETNIHGSVVDIKTVGIKLFSSYVLVVEMSSMLLLGALVAAFHIGRDKEYNTVDTNKLDH